MVRRLCVVLIAATIAVFSVRRIGSGVAFGAKIT